ncbi:hypothetical protein [Parapedobacter indicus]|uniref:Uncharacterized protein n=1 Tax=Parapedobacter indicus TaxID=1477437 RepID=A0A1I3TH72_9SPHI|nr:hypothetical protein [Parapedobacter indicus]PPK99500.1 hypothetical protein CLV26_11218 [Parapedobacter indicus]SFJ69863.1 hypothetical protein SAMN05444682_112163 [Parapedobacter indicus]
MVFSKLEQLSLQVEGGVGLAGDVQNFLEQLQHINGGISEMLEAVVARQQEFENRLAIRRQLQEVFGSGNEMPAGARRMYVEDQLAFYRQLIGEMLAFFTGSEHGRCVSFSLTVEELLFFIRLLLEEKVMDAGALKPIFLFLSRHARTAGSGTLSYESLRKKYSGVQLGAKRRVGELLLRLVQRAERHITDK